MLKVVLCLAFAGVALAQIANPVVTVRDGQLRGISKTTVNGVNYYQFAGIPYAQPPTGSLRFKAPVPHPSWTGVREATQFGSGCVQADPTSVILVSGDEDCLFLNVFTKTLPEEAAEPRPVIVWIHGGGFNLGSSTSFGPDYILDKDVVIVTINYRLHIFGFLSTQDDNAPGNAGLKDQTLALKWVKENIASFNGDPNQITIMGESAGSAAVEYQIITPLSQGYFNQAFMTSGSTLNRWALQPDPLYHLYYIATALGLIWFTHSQLIAELQLLNSYYLMEYALLPVTVGEYSLLSTGPFGPVIEHDHSGAFMTASAFSLLQSGNFQKVPFVAGYMSSEGILAQQVVDVGGFNILDYLLMSTYVPEAMNDVDDSYEVGSIVKEYWMGDEPPTNKELFIRMLSHEMFVRGIRKSVQFKRGVAPGWFFEFTYKGTYTTDYQGVAHGEDVHYFWRYQDNDLENSQDHLARERLVTLLYNFVSTGNPTPVEDPLLGNVIWPEITASGDLPYLDVGVNVVVGSNPNQTEFNWWENLFNQYGKPPYLFY